MRRRIYLVGSLRNPMITALADQLRQDGHDVFDDWFAAGQDADDIWRAYEEVRGRSYIDALEGAHANNVFAFDRDNILKSDTVILVMPAGNSAHLELGFAAGAGKDTHILLDGSVKRWDIMYRFASQVWDDSELMRYSFGANVF